MQVFAIFAAWRARFSQVVIILSQRRGGREGSAGYIGLCDLCGLARKKYPASNEALAKARRTQRIVYDECMNMYVKQTSRMISQRWCQCREGLHALPQTMFDRFSKRRWCFKSAVVFFQAVFSKAVGTFFEGGHEALPCAG